MWNEVNFGKWSDKGKTLPQIVVSDPDWFFWALEEKAYKALQAEAEKLARRAKAIKLPAPLAATHCIQYLFTPDSKFSGFNVIKSDQPEHIGSSSELRRPTLDLSMPRAVKTYDKLGAKLLLKTFKYYWFENKNFARLKVEAFFDDRTKFVDP